MCVGLNTADCISALNLLVTAIGAGAVFVQLRKLSKQSKLEHYSDYTKRYQEIALHFPEDVNAQDFVLEGRPGYNEEMRYFRAYFDLCFEEWDLQNRKLIDEEFWKGWRGGMQFAFSKPAFKQAWRKIKSDSSFGHEFEKFVDDSMQNSYAPRVVM